MIVWVTGAAGLIGSALCARLRAQGVRVVRLVRGEPEPNQIRWDGETGVAPAANLPDCDAVIHLAARSIGGGRITAAAKHEIRRSRIDATRTLCASLSRLPKPPPAVICASGIGYYGNRADHVLTESTELGGGFLAELVHEWEEACDPARQAGIRVVNLRMGPVLSTRGGMLKQMLPAFRLGVGGPIGHGTQYIPWVSLPDAVAAFQFALENPTVNGAYNLCSPRPVTMNEFARTLGAVLRRPAFFRVPPAVLRLLFGDVVESMATDSIRAIPERLSTAGFTFQDTDLEPTLRRVLNKAKPHVEA